MSLAEKFQITVPAKDEDGEGWAGVKSVRKTHDCEQPCDGAKFNRMPRIEIDEMHPFAHGLAGSNDVSGIRKATDYEQGFARREMKSTDDQYGGEHIDLFYGEAVDEKGNHGFVERNNYLDRM